MTVKTILVCLTNYTTAPDMLRAAILLARTNNAHVIGLHIIQAMIVYPGIAMHIPASVFEQFDKQQAEEALAIKAIFEEHTVGGSFVAEWSLQHTKSTKASDRVIDSARTVDLVLMPNDEPELEPGDQAHLQEEVIRECGRPVLVVPRGFDAQTIGTDALVGWNGTSEVARAVHDALALLANSAKAHIVRVHCEDDDLTNDPTLSEIANGYARHGIETSIGHCAWKRGHVAQILEHEAFERGSDLLVMGAFSHSRAYELIHGSTTRKLLRHTKRPVLFSC